MRDKDKLALSAEELAALLRKRTQERKQREQDKRTQEHREMQQRKQAAARRN